MKPSSFGMQRWRIFRNGLIAALVLAFWFGSYFWIMASLWNLLWVVPGCFLGWMALRVIGVVHPSLRFSLRRGALPAPDLEVERVAFPSCDGLTLSGWYAPGEKRAVVILAHGAGSQSLAMTHYARALVDCGYGVLMLDLRAHGHSQGDTCTGGWLEAEDVLGAAEYLQGRTDVDLDKIGAFGISLGAKSALWAAARSPIIAAVVAEGPGPACLADHGERPTTPGRWTKYLVNGLLYEFLYFVSGVRPLAGILTSGGDIAPRPVLLISAGTGGEREFVRRLYHSAREPKEMWGLPEAQHGAGYFSYPDLYAQKIVTFFDKAFDLCPTGA